MALIIIEDGSQVANANSFVTDAEYTTYSTARGLTVGATVSDREQELIKAIDYLQSVENSLQGYRSSSTQELIYPRYGVTLYGYVLASDKIPKELKNAQMEAAAYATSGVLLTNTSNNNIKSEQVASLKTEYFEGSNTETLVLKRVNAQLRPLLQDADTLVRT